MALFLKQTLSRRVINDLRSRSIFGIILYPLILSVVLLEDGVFARHPVFFTQFSVLVGGMCLFRLVHRMLDPHLQEAWDRLSLGFFIGEILICALIWGVGLAKFMGQHGESRIQMLLMVCTIGLGSGGCVAYSTYLWLALGYNLMMFGPSMVYMLVLGGNWPLLTLFALFSAYMMHVSIRANTEYRTAMANEALLEQKTRDLERLSNMDGLTGLYNRRYFETAFSLTFEQAIRQNSCLALVICDIDFFKQINDEYGHLAGDEYLKVMSRNIEQVFRRKSDITARYGGEEFVVLLSNVEKGQAFGLAEEFRRKMAETELVFESRIIKATVSQGIAEWHPDPYEKKEAMFSIADDMLYMAKANGRNQIRINSR